MSFVVFMPIVCLAFMRKTKNQLNTFLKWKPPWFKNHSLFIGDGPHLSFVHSCLFKVFFFCSVSNGDQPFTQLCCYQLCQFISSLVNFKHFFFPLCNLFFFIFPPERLRKVWKGMFKMGGVNGNGYVLRRTDWHYNVFLEETLILLFLV